MKKNYLFIFSMVVFLGLIFSIYQYYNVLKLEDVSSASVIPNPGHSWDEMECSSDILCIDATNKKIGIGTDTPTQLLDVNGNARINGNLYLTGQIITTVVGVCGTKNGKYATSTPTGTEACATGTITGMTGSYVWTCAGSNGGADSGTCSTVVANYGTASFATVGNHVWTAPSNVTSIEYLVVGGGGSGGVGYGGGGGGGGFLTGTMFVSVGSAYSITVGDGGVATASNSSGAYGKNGGNSNFSTIIATGGGGGGYTTKSGLAGGSGGGGGGDNGATTVGGDSDYLSPKQGYDGGNGSSGNSGYERGGGGGGAGGSGGAGGHSSGGIGGVGMQSSIAGTSVYYAGGGGGGSSAGGGGAGGSGGGGAGSQSSPVNGVNGSGGGGGGRDYYGTGSTGGSGIVILRYINNY